MKVLNSLEIGANTPLTISNIVAYNVYTVNNKRNGENEMNKEQLVKAINELNLGTEDSGYPLGDYSEEKLEELYNDLQGVDCNDTESLRKAFDKLES